MCEVWPVESNTVRSIHGSCRARPLVTTTHQTRSLHTQQLPRKMPCKL